MRLNSTREATQKLAETPYLFAETRQTDQPYLLILRVSSEQRKFVPLGYIGSDVICKDLAFMLLNASLYDFGLLSSTMHNAWMRAVCGRLKNDYSYSNTIVYNNFPFLDGRVGNAHSTELKPSVRKRIETTAQKVLDARKAE
jgi:hypothetical protein